MIWPPLGGFTNARVASPSPPPPPHPPPLQPQLPPSLQPQSPPLQPPPLEPLQQRVGGQSQPPQARTQKRPEHSQGPPMIVGGPNSHSHGQYGDPGAAGSAFG